MSKSAIVFFGPKPEKNAFAFEDLFEPSITNILSREYPIFFEYFSILFILFVGVSIAQTTGFWPITSVDLYQKGALVHHSDSVLFEGEMAEVVIDGLATKINRS